MGIEKQCFEAQYWISSPEFVQNDKRYARNLMVIARMPGDLSKHFKILQAPSKPYTPVCVHL
eukprot:14211793-Heterocapsa_arctica.AAC.1